VTVYGVYHDFFAALDFVVLAGRVFDQAHAEDESSVDGGTIPASIVVDRSFAEQHGWHPQQAIGKMVYMRRRQGDEQTPKALRIIGVVKDRPMTLVGFGATSTVYRYFPAAVDALLIRVDKHAIPQALAVIDASWDKVAPQLAINRKFADELLDHAFWMFSLVNAFLIFASVAALSVAMLGIIGMSLHTIGRRRHEIGVRKTLGASVDRIGVLLLADFSKPVVIANIIAWPLAFIAMRAYLGIFVRPIGLTLAPFMQSLVLSLLVAWAAVLVQVVRAARLQPSRVLRYE
jgi:putative ABC transport system permease protein